MEAVRNSGDRIYARAHLEMHVVFSQFMEIFSLTADAYRSGHGGGHQAIVGGSCFSNEHQIIKLTHKRCSRYAKLLSITASRANYYCPPVRGSRNAAISTLPINSAIHNEEAMKAVPRLSFRLAGSAKRSIATSRPKGPQSRSQNSKQDVRAPLSRRSQNLKEDVRSPPLSRRTNAQPKTSPSNVETVSSTLLQTAKNEQSDLVSPVHIPEDPHGVLRENHPAMSILSNSSIVVQRQLEMMNILMGFEQANKYVIMDPLGNHIGYLAEQEHGMTNLMARQMLRTRRSFTTHVFDRNQREVLRVKNRPVLLVRCLCS